MDWLDLLAVQGTLKSLLQHHSSKASILWHSAFFTVQLSHLYMTTGKTIALTRWTFVGKVMFLLLNMLFRLVIAFLPRSKHLLISWLQSWSVVNPIHYILLLSPNPWSKTPQNLVFMSSSTSWWYILARSFDYLRCPSLPIAGPAFPSSGDVWLNPVIGVLSRKECSWG